MNLCCYCEPETVSLFNNDGPIWQLIALLIAASGGILTLVFQNVVQKKKDKKKLAMELSSEAVRLNSILISQYRSFAENYFGSFYFYGTSKYFTDEYEKKVVISHAEEDKRNWKERQGEFQASMANFSKVLNQWLVNFGADENINDKLIEQRQNSLPVHPDYNTCKNTKDCLDLKKKGDAQIDNVLNKHREIGDAICVIITSKARELNN